MTLVFTNVVKGLVSQALFKALLERAGYRVTRLGIEELFGEVKYLDMHQYLGLNLPLQLRYLPDLLVADSDMSNVFLVEMKFRRRFDQITAESLYDELRQQHEHWPQAYTVIMVAEPIRTPAKFHQDYIRVLKPEQLDLLCDQHKHLDQRWEELHHVHRVFRLFNQSGLAADLQKDADRITSTLRQLAEL